MVSDLPTGVVTFLFTDIEGSTRLLSRVGDDFGELLDEHHLLIREATTSWGGMEIHTEGDAFFIVFGEASSGGLAALEAQHALSESRLLGTEDVRVRMGLHVGDAILGGDDYVGMDVHVAARVSAAAHGGQILVTESFVEAVGDDLKARADFDELGEYWLRDIPEPIRLAQLRSKAVASDFPPIAAASIRPYNAPFFLSAFVGRADDVDRATRALAEQRLLTLTGPGGTGKTRLAVEVGSVLTRQFVDGVFFVPLAGITDPQAVPSAILDVLGAPGAEPGVTPTIQLGSFLQHKQVLLIVDNCEQVLSAAPIFSLVLDAARAIKILATSRAPLGLDGEKELQVVPLAVPSDRPDQTTEEISASAAIRLFVERARSIRDGFTITRDNAQAVRTIVRRLDGLPLAIELAAARIRMLTPDAILLTLEPLSLRGRKADPSVNQRTLRDTIQWSVDLLHEPEGRLLSRLAAFVGGADMEQIEEVCRPTELGLDLVDSLGILVENSLLFAGEPGPTSRFHMLETIREYGLERLTQSPDGDTTRERHMSAFVRLAEDAAPHLEGAEATTWVNRLRSDNSNLQTALTHAIETGHAENAQRIVGSLWQYWKVRGHLEDAARLAASSLALDGAPTEVRARALDAAGSIQYWRGDTPATRDYYELALEAHRSVGDRTGIANATYNLSFPVGDQDGYTAGRALLEQALALFEESGDLRGQTRALEALARSWLTESPQRSAKYAKRAIRAGSKLEDAVTVAWANSLYGTSLALMGQHQRAVEVFQSALSAFNKIGDVIGTTINLAAIADSARLTGDTPTALYLAGGVTVLWKNTGAGIITSQDKAIAELTKEDNLTSLSTDLQDEFTRGQVTPLPILVDAAFNYSIQPESERNSENETEGSSRSSHRP